MDGFECASCGAYHDNFDGVLEMTFDGWGDRGLIDTFGEGPQTSRVCVACARKMIEAFPWMGEYLRRLFNINYAHTCLDGSLKWTAESRCLVDFDRHGWRKIYIVRPSTRQPDEGPCYYRAFDVEEEAVAACEALNRNVISCRVVAVPVGNLHHYTRISLEDRHSESDWI